MFYFFVIITFIMVVILIIFSILYINKLEAKIDALIDSFDEMDIVDSSSIEKKILYKKIKEEKRHRW